MPNGGLIVYLLELILKAYGLVKQDRWILNIAPGTKLFFLHLVNCFILFSDLLLCVSFDRKHIHPSRIKILLYCWCYLDEVLKMQIASSLFIQHFMCVPESVLTLYRSLEFSPIYQYFREGDTGICGVVVLRCWCLFTAVMRWIKSQFVVLRWS